MRLYPRLPALVAMVLTAAIGLGLMAGTGQFRTTDLSHATLAELEKQIVHTQDGKVWLAYGDKLLEEHRTDPAMKAFQRAAALQPDLVEARIKMGIAIGQGGNADAFFTYISRLCISYPKVAADLLERPELSSLHTHPKWDEAVVSAKAQAVD